MPKFFGKMESTYSVAAGMFRLIYKLLTLFVFALPSLAGWEFDFFYPSMIAISQFTKTNFHKLFEYRLYIFCIFQLAIFFGKILNGLLNFVLVCVDLNDSMKNTTVINRLLKYILRIKCYTS